MRWNSLIRSTHRWVSIVFTLAVMANMGAMAVGTQEVWIGLAALFPLVILLLTGLYLFVLPFVARRRQRAAS